MPEIEVNKDKNRSDQKTHSTSSTKEKTESSEKPSKPSPEATPTKSAWDLPDGEFSEVFDSEGHRNRINRY